MIHSEYISRKANTQKYSSYKPRQSRGAKGFKEIFLKVINKYRATVIEKKVCLQKRICHRLAPSKDFTIMPPKLRHNAPKIIKTVPGTLLNSVNLSL